MKASNLLVVLGLVGFTTLSGIPTNLISPQSNLVRAEAKADATGLTLAQKIEFLTKEKGNFGSGDALRRFFFGDLEPIGIQKGGAGMVVNLYNKTNNYTFSYCATYDVVVGIRKGKVTVFPAAEVK
jgi:hypothetical protein